METTRETGWGGGGGGRGEERRGEGAEEAGGQEYGVVEVKERIRERE